MDVRDTHNEGSEFPAKLEGDDSGEVGWEDRETGLLAQL